jgi:hypothetical protein
MLRHGSVWVGYDGGYGDTARDAVWSVDGSWAGVVGSSRRGAVGVWLRLRERDYDDGSSVADGTDGYVRCVGLSSSD